MLDKDLFALAKGKLRYVALSVVISLVSLLLNIVVTASVVYAISLAARGADVSQYVLPSVAAVVAVALRVAAGICTGRIKATLGDKIKSDLRAKTYDKITKLGVRTTEEMSMAGLTQVSLEGIEQLDLYYSSYLPQFFYSLIAPFVLFAICVFIDLPTSLLLICCVPLIPVSIVAVSKYAKKIFAKYWGKYTSMGDGFLDCVQGLKELKIFKADARYHKKMNENAEEFRKITMKVLVMQLASTTIMDLIAFGGAGGGIALAVSGMANGNITPFQTLFLCLVAVEFFLPLRALGSAFHIAMNGASAGKKIKALLDAKEPEWGDENVEDVQIRLDKVDFPYVPSRQVLKDLSGVFPSKGVTALVGESGSGKSTVAGLLTGALRAQNGEVTVGGKKIGNLSRESYYDSIAAVSCNTYIFNDTVRNNFALINGDVSDDEIYAALRKVNLDRFVSEQGGLDKMINEDGSNISGGQKQRLALAVNLVKDKKFYVFDEATSNIDAESEAIIMKNVYDLGRRAGVLIISHRLENVTDADNIFYLKEGKAEECGTHAELMAKDGEYAKLYNTQKSLETGYKTCGGEI